MGLNIKKKDKPIVIAGAIIAVFMILASTGFLGESMNFLGALIPSGVELRTTMTAEVDSLTMLEGCSGPIAFAPNE